jgi:hypothetical protein
VTPVLPDAATSAPDAPTLETGRLTWLEQIGTFSRVTHPPAEEGKHADGAFEQARWRLPRDERTPVSTLAEETRLASLCTAAVGSTGVSACGVTLMTKVGQGITAHATDDRARAVEDLQHTLGEGPVVDAAVSGASVLVPDLTDRATPAFERWSTFARDAVELGVEAAFAFPLLLGTSCVGALGLYRTAAGPLSAAQESEGWLSAGTVAMTLAEGTRGLPKGPGLDPMTVHQAAGMVMMQLDVPIDQALLRMRATAYAEGLTVDELADAIVARRRRLSKEET